MKIYCSRVVNSDGTEDMEFLDSEPTESFIEGLWECIGHGTVQFFCIREGNVNGGDSIILYSSIG
jgi:hypothetical protein